MSTRSVLGRVVTWPFFLTLAAIHLAVLPALLSEREDDVAAILAGVVYLAFAVVDLTSRRRRGGVRAGPPRRRPTHS
jgi:predicted lysophospholipase L1 biosynthesis ABC-type transport system permease subunit